MGSLFWKGKQECISNIEALKKKELVPFQLLESISTPMSIKNDQDWMNLLIRGDSLLTIHSLLNKFKGAIKLIYIDPPFATGGEFDYKIQIGEGDDSKKSSKWIRKQAYTDAWKDGLDSYLNFLYERLLLMKDLLADDGSIYMHLDWHVGHYIKVMMDEIFGDKNFRNEIIWSYPAASAKTKRFYVRSYDTILFYTKSDNYLFNDDPNIYMEYSNRVKNALNKDVNGIFYYRGGSHDGKKLSQKVYIENKGVFPRDVWTDIPYVRANTIEYQGFSTQKPERLLRRIILASTKENDLIADFFSGSGTTVVVAEKLNRRWIGCDLSKNAIQITKKRLLDIKNSNNLFDWKKKYDKIPREFKILTIKHTIEENGFPLDFFSKKENKSLNNMEYLPPHFEIILKRNANEISLEIKDYKIPYIDFISYEIKEKISKFSDWIDFWAIDYDFTNQKKFRNMWVSYRTSKKRTLKLESNPYYYEKPGNYKIMVKVLDICGVETTKVLDLDIN
ncbi:MAG: site-specific DNA-methyltransferase [Promethearchaeota archaeon]